MGFPSNILYIEIVEMRENISRFYDMKNKSEQYISNLFSFSSSSLHLFFFCRIEFFTYIMLNFVFQENLIAYHNNAG